MSYSREFEQYEHKRKIVEAETNSFGIQQMSFEIYKKTVAEKANLSGAKSHWKQGMKNFYGKDWKRHNNIPIL